MQRYNGRVLVSATDLVGFHDCEHLTYLDRRALDDPELRARKVEADEHGQLIQRKGTEFEGRYLEQLSSNQRVVEIVRNTGRLNREAEDTLAAMREGAPVIYQATFLNDGKLGHADFLRRVEQPSTLGAWSYEAVDTKLARSEKASRRRSRRSGRGCRRPRMSSASGREIRSPDRPSTKCSLGTLPCLSISSGHLP